jgi:general secretion pathway protein G
MRAWWRRPAAGGFSFIEMIIATALLMILASAALPIVRISVRRQREADLHRALREMRLAIDKYQDACTLSRIAATDVTAQCYPPDLQTLVDGAPALNSTADMKYKFLRRIPIDPITGKAEWGYKAVTDPPDSKGWGGGNVFDVYSKADGTALDKTKYRDW